MMPGRLAGARIVQGPHCKSPDQEVLKLGRNTGGGVVEVPIMMNIHHVLRDELNNQVIRPAQDAVSQNQVFLLT